MERSQPPNNRRFTHETPITPDCVELFEENPERRAAYANRYPSPTTNTLIISPLRKTALAPASTSIVRPAFTVTQDDDIVVDGKPLRKQERVRLWIYHKPPGLVTTAKDPQGRPTVFEDVPKKLGRVISVGRLDLNSEGLLLLTNSGALSRHLELPSTALPRVYQVRTYGELDMDALKDLRNGITIDDVRYKPIQVYVENPDNDSANNWLEVTLHEGKNREIRKIFEHFGCSVSRLLRLSYGPFQLGSLPKGEVKEVTGKVLKSFIGS